MGSAVLDTLREFGQRLIALSSPAEESSDIVKLAAADGEFEVEVARPGRFTAMGGRKVNLTSAVLEELAATHDSATLRTPNKIGHPDPNKTDTPAYGFVTGLRYDAGKERLLAKVDASPDLRQLIRDKKFTERSIEFDRNYQGTGKARFLGLGWLGATPPAVDGLAALASGVDTASTVCVMALAEPEQIDGDEDLYYLATFTAADRKKLADEGAAMPDGSYPIRNQADLENAKQAFGRAKDPAATKAHIIKRAKALGLTKLLPADWSGSTKVAAASGRTEEEMAEESTAIQLAETKTKLERLTKQLKDAAAERSKAFMAANVKRIPLSLVKGGLEGKLTALFAADAEEERVVKFAGTDGKDATLSMSALVTEILAGLPEQVTMAETTETTSKGTDGDEKDAGMPERMAGNWDAQGDEYYKLAQVEIEAERAKGNKIDFAEAAKRIYAKRGDRG